MLSGDGCMPIKVQLSSLFDTLVAGGRENQNKLQIQDAKLSLEKAGQFFVAKGVISSPHKTFQGVVIEPTNDAKLHEIFAKILVESEGCQDQSLLFAHFEKVVFALADIVVKSSGGSDEPSESKVSILLNFLLKPSDLSPPKPHQVISPSTLESLRFGRDSRRNSVGSNVSGRPRSIETEQTIFDDDASQGSAPYWPGVVGAHSPQNRHSRPSSSEWVDITDQAVLDTIRIVNPDDKDWHLSQSSIITFLQSRGLTDVTCELLKPGVLAAMFLEADADKDGLVDKKELKLACSVGRHRFRQYTELWVSLVRLACSKALARRHHSPEVCLRPKVQERHHAGPTRQAIVAQFERPGTHHYARTSASARSMSPRLLSLRSLVKGR
jgi:hypothetical protein